MHELAVGADHLFARKRNLLDWPTVLVHSSHRCRFQSERGCQQPGRGVVWVVDGIHPEGLGLRFGDDIWQDQVFPDLGSDGNLTCRPGFYSIWGAGGDGFAIVASWQRAGFSALDGLAAFATLGPGLGQ